MTHAVQEHTFRLGDRIRLRVESRATAHRGGWGDVIGLLLTEEDGPQARILVGWADGSQSWEHPIELRLAAER